MRGLTNDIRVWRLHRRGESLGRSYSKGHAEILLHRDRPSWDGSLNADENALHKNIMLASGTRLGDWPLILTLSTVTVGTCAAAMPTHAAVASEVKERRIVENKQSCSRKNNKRKTKMKETQACDAADRVVGSCGAISRPLYPHELTPRLLPESWLTVAKVLGLQRTTWHLLIMAVEDES